jgi:KDO2-lipid IV(A) lauroyltransferase
VRRRSKTLELWATRQFARSLLAVGHLMPDFALPALGAGVGRMLALAMPRWRRVARENLRRALGVELSDAQIERLLRRNFTHYGRTLVEFLVMRRWRGVELERRVKLEGREWAEAALEKQQGVILVTAHYGNWELLAARVAHAGYPLNVIARDADDPGTNELINRIRGDCGYRVISRRDSARPALRCLRQNEMLGILLDQNTLSGEVFVPFFGHPAATATGPAVLARRTGATILPIFSRRRPDGTHLARFLPPVEFAVTDNQERDLHEITARVTAVIEAEVRSEPTQWLWIHQRWKKQCATR